LATETVRFQGEGGLSLAADVFGDPSAPPVILLHGGGQTRHSWRTTAEVLSQRGMRAVSLDLRGHGDSDWAPDGDYGIDAFAGDIRAVVSQVGAPPALVGASLGGIAALVVVGESARPLATALVLVDVAPRIEQAGAQRIGDFMRDRMEEGFATLEEAAVAVAAYNPQRPRPPDPSGLEKNLRRRPDGRWIWHWDPKFMQPPAGGTDETRVTLMQAARLEASARAVDVPTLLVRGRMSDLLSEDGARQFRELVPRAEYVDVAGAGHMVAGDRNDAFNDSVVSFLQNVVGG
jgi:pimeloyl-ACP methyl ester carboxylesterase